MGYFRARLWELFFSLYNRMAAGFILVGHYTEKVVSSPVNRQGLKFLLSIPSPQRDGPSHIVWFTNDLLHGKERRLLLYLDGNGLLLAPWRLTVRVNTRKPSFNSIPMNKSLYTPSKLTEIGCCMCTCWKKTIPLASYMEVKIAMKII